MSTIVAPTTDVPSKNKNLVEMNWDPITRIVGSLGIFTN
jgi:hydrogenase large subunit